MPPSPNMGMQPEPASRTGVNLGITPVATSMRPGPDLADLEAQVRGQRRFVGIDTLAVGFGVTFSREPFDALCARLEAAKVAAQESDDPNEASFVLGRRTWTVQPSGWRLGDNGRGPYIAFAIAHEGVVVGMMRRDRPLGPSTPNVYVTVGSSACLSRGSLEVIIMDLRGIINDLGGTIEFEKVGRCDVFVDLEGVQIGDVARAWVEDRVVCRAKKSSAFGLHRNGRKKWQGIQIGRALMFRAYDKIEELKDQPQKRALWNAIQWNDEAPRVVTRFEFEMKREKLSEFEKADGSQGIDTLDDLLFNIGRIALYLTQRWMRFTRAAVDRTNTSRAAFADFWRRVCDAVQAWTTSAEPATRRFRPKVGDVEALIRQFRGCIESAAALLSRPKAPRSLLDVCQFARELLYDQDKRERQGKTPHIYAESIAGKRQRYESRAPIRSRDVGVWAT